MNKMIRKLVAAIMALVLTAVLAVTVSYAWMTISSNPVVEGIQISIGGGTTILVAADTTQTVNGTVYHYPGKFSNTLNFKQYDSYDYLNDLSALTPVSTADGVHWFLSEYYDYNDPEVMNGEAVVGQVKPIEAFGVDRMLNHANLPKEQSEQALQGHYIYLDFWVVSPHSDYTLRVSQGDDNGGSFALELMSPEKGEDDRYTLIEATGNAAAYARIGFLANEDTVLDDSIMYYQHSSAAVGEYTKLKGTYHDPRDTAWYRTGRFTIYEPNADWHAGEQNGMYIVTEPVAYQAGKNVYANISSQLTAQLSNTWKGMSSQGITLEQMFVTWQAGKDLSSMTLEQIKKAFYKDYLQGLVAPYVAKGDFIANTAALYGCGDFASSDQLSSLLQGGATEDVYITTLEKNVPQRIRMFIWLEGQDVDCTGSANASDFALSIELAGSNQ